MRLVGKRNTAEVILNEKKSFSAKPGLHLSAFAIGGDAEGVSIRGLYYQAEDITLTPQFALAVSNVFVDADAEIEVKRGALLVITENEN